MTFNNSIKIGKKTVGKNSSVFIIAEIGINHNGDIDIAKKLIDTAASAGCDAVKFQKRNPDICVPEDQKEIIRETPWGVMKYIDYKHKVELDYDQYKEIDRYCKQKDIIWFASCWDKTSIDFIDKFNPPCYKIASACLTDDDLITHISKMGRPIILSTGMSTMEDIRHAITIIKNENLAIAHCTSSYPCKVEDLNLMMIKTLKEEFQIPIGYSGHEVGLQTSYAAVALGACFIERHITLDRAMWGSDQAASIEPVGLLRFVRDIRTIEKAMGTGIKRIYESEEKIKSKLRRF